MMDREEMDAYMAKERRRASMMAQLRGHVPMEAGATEASLQAEYLELMGEPYRTAVEEATAIHAARQVEREAEQQARLDADEQAIADARTSGFMDCRAIRDALGFDGQKANGSHYDSMGVAYRFIGDAGEAVVHLIPDDGRAYYIGGARKKIAKTRRTGVYADAFQRVKAHKERYYAAMSGTPEERLAMSEGVAAGREARRAALVQQRRDFIIEKMRTYDGPLNRRGLPKMRALRNYLGMYIKAWERNELWALT